MIARVLLQSLRFLAFAAVVLAGPAVSAQGVDRLRLGYDVLYSGVTIAVLDIDTTVTASAFEVNSHVATTGFFNTLMPLTVQSRSEGRVSAGALVPVRHVSESRGRSSVRRIAADYQGGRLVRFERRVTPPDPAVASQISDDERLGATDPATAILGLVLGVAYGRGCAAEVTSFDGRRLHLIRFADGGRQRSPSSVPVAFAGQTVLCTFSYYSRDGAEPNTPTRAGRAWIGRVRPDGAMAPLRVELETRWGTAAVQLRTVPDAAAAN